MRRWTIVMAVGAAALTASLFLPWREVSCGEGCAPAQGAGVIVPPIGSGAASVDGWASGAGDAAALAALLVLAAAALALARPALADRLPLATCAAAAAYFGLAVAVSARSVAEQRGAGATGAGFADRYGTYLGLAAAAALAAAAVGLPRRELGRLRSRARLVPAAAAAALLGALLVPWARLEEPLGAAEPGIALPAGTAAAALALCLLGTAWRNGAGRGVAVLAGATGALTVAAFASIPSPMTHEAGAWAGLGAAVVLAALAAVGLARPGSLPRRDALVTGSAAALLVAGLSLPWQRACYARSGEFGAYAGHCVPTSAWTSDLGVAAALLALGAVVLTVAPRRFPAQAVPACGAALLVGILALQLEEQRLDGVTLEAGPGWVVGAVGAALLLAATFGHARPRRGGLALPTARLVPAAACAAYIVIVALPWSNELPQGAAQALGFAPVSWLTIAGVVLALALLQLWVAPRALAAAGAASVALLPVAMLALAAVELLRLRDDGLNWGRGGVAALCLLLAALGRIEQRGGLERFELPGALRVDRL